MFKKHDLRFPAEGGIELSAWLFVPEGHKLPLPAITMAHGYAGTKYHGIEPIAEAFAEAGFVVLVHDHRGFGVTDRRLKAVVSQVPTIDGHAAGLRRVSLPDAFAARLTERRILGHAPQRVPIGDGWTCAAQ
ncbi:hypothetical protein HGP14_23545 [Rhizobium sp. P32RR-XVIII]|uniref:alpha/beta hydrolase n=1 Tax=Rhizobium sp. P32RR-XVIII TaxID=2726738 RepID=UPI00145751E0|nr:acetylxylan esterase [Rhizobium sp. P32RR-XVIII]NLS06298.1 hypothetical protein [Rhizobium sp. P32RR-XVIII]